VEQQWWPQKMRCSLGSGVVHWVLPRAEKFGADNWSAMRGWLRKEFSRQRIKNVLSINCRYCKVCPPNCKSFSMTEAKGKSGKKRDQRG
jgi:hypothetical protein